ncbi:PHD finger protein 20 [Colletotrichum chlorophyti]|uniref:PHD finger protein 20 n=1 Tax=Colletotrichum chlorophyti TaxID=708187 RepID=A0A1Q8S003_9PEZI|nr:PHD finger protein 20 [Colletotrichum chlorophyti]
MKCVFSFGNPNAQPPTPEQTPTAAVFPSPVFETPKERQGHFDDAGTWTPRFAEEYSVFNTTPGNLRGSEGTFADFASTTTYPPSASLKRPLSVESLAAQIATHANHFSPNPNLHLPPVALSRRLPSSPRPPTEQTELSAQENGSSTSEVVTQDESLNKAGNTDTAADLQGQTATPPPSSHKGGRKLVPKIQADNMQNDHGYGQPDFSGTPHQPNMATFVNANDMFGFPLSAPSNTSTSFWDPAADMSAMDIDFSFGPNIFQPGHRHMPSFDASQMFQETTTLPPSNNQTNAQSVKRTRPLAPKPVRHNVHSSSADISMASASFSTSADDPFGIVSPGGPGVDPGMLFSRRPPSASMDVAVPVTQGSAQFALAAATETQSRAPMHGDVRRSMSTRELAPSKLSPHILGSSPTKLHGRPSGLQRSVSESRGRRRLPNTALPKLAPAIQPKPQGNIAPAVGPSRPLSRPSGRISPLKQQHSRLSSLTSIPETSSPRPRTSVKFTIDSKGRARAETTVVMDESQSDNMEGRPVAREMPRREKSWDSEDDESSTDDEPIIIPSRNTSFALPDPRQPSSASLFHSSRRSVSEHSSSSFGASPSQHDAESEAETVINEAQGKGGDAASELRKLVENRHRRPQAPGSQRSQRFASGSFRDHQGGLVSPTAFTEASLPSPSKTTYNVRCVCRNSGDRQGEYMVQCESCEMWLHGSCINITRRTLPSVYICAFCSNTPNMRAGRVRGNGPTPGPSRASPLTRKSFR